jgi:hypothetical protein
MAKVYLVVIDTTNRQAAKGWSKGIQNFYFVYANDGKMAEQMVLASFAARPELRAQLVPCVKATPLDSIVKLLNARENSWSYIPIGGVRAPGQQGVIPVADPNDPAYARMADKDFVPAPPKTYSGQNDTVIDPHQAGALTEDDKSLLAKRAPAPAVAPQIDLTDPNVVALLAAVLQKAGVPLAAPTVPVVPNEPVAQNFVPPKTLRQDELDAETLKRIRSNIVPNGNVDVNENDEEVAPQTRRHGGVVNNTGKNTNEWGEPIG